MQSNGLPQRHQSLFNQLFELLNHWSINLYLQVVEAFEPLIEGWA